MRFEVEEIGTTAQKISLIGRLDSDTIARVEVPLTATIAASGRSAMLDLTRLDFLSSLGIRLLLSAARVVQRRGGRLVLFGARPAVMDVLVNLALDSVLPHVETEAEAHAILDG